MTTPVSNLNLIYYVPIIYAQNNKIIAYISFLYVIYTCIYETKSVRNALI